MKISVHSSAIALTNSSMLSITNIINLYNIVFIQKSSWNFICFVVFTTVVGGDEVISTPIHLDWTQIV